MRKISILGSTGSVGQTTLKVIAKHPAEFSVVALAAKQNISSLERQARRFRPRIVSVWDEEKALTLKTRLRGTRIKVVHGRDGLCEVAVLEPCDRVVFALNGIQGLEPLFEAIKKKKDIAIANKELLVIAGGLIKKAVSRNNVKCVPIDSEHSAIFQCLEGHKRTYVKKIIITASGGPFIDYPLHKLRSVTPQQALRHPRWKMGPKITIDSATMMNKGLEIIEAASLYGVSVDDIEIIVHRESIVHSLVEFIDGSVLAQLSNTDMCFPVLYALSYPERLENRFARLNLTDINKLSFEEPDFKKFPCLKLAYSAGAIGGTMPVVMSAANEVAVTHFLQHKISFVDIPTTIGRVMKRHRVIQTPTVNQIIAVDTWAREESLKQCSIL